MPGFDEDRGAFDREPGDSKEQRPAEDNQVTIGDRLAEEIRKASISVDHIDAKLAVYSRMVEESIDCRKAAGWIDEDSMTVDTGRDFYQKLRRFFQMHRPEEWQEEGRLSFTDYGANFEGRLVAKVEHDVDIPYFRSSGILQLRNSDGDTLVPFGSLGGEMRWHCFSPDEPVAFEVMESRIDEQSAYTFYLRYSEAAFQKELDNICSGRAKVWRISDTAEGSMLYHEVVEAVAAQYPKEDFLPDPAEVVAEGDFELYGQTGGSEYSIISESELGRSIVKLHWKKVSGLVAIEVDSI